jgi:hypothetical protein
MKRVDLMETRFEVQFKEIVEAFCLGFEDIHLVNDGGYERGYAEGHDVGFAEGENVGYANGYDKGVEDTMPSGEIELTENNKTYDVAAYATARARVPAPEIFAPIIVEMFDRVQWRSNEKNGNFPVIITATVDGEEVTSPLMITEEMNGKNLIIRAECENFKSTEQIIPLVYRALDMSDGTHSVFFTSGAPEPPKSSPYPYKPILEVTNTNLLAGVECIAVMNDKTYKRTSSDSWFYNEVEFNKLYREQFYIEVTEAIKNAYCYQTRLHYQKIYTNGFWQGAGTASDIPWTSGAIRVKIYVNGELRAERTNLTGTTKLGSLEVGDKITFFIEAHVVS